MMFFDDDDIFSLQNLPQQQTTVDDARVNDRTLGTFRRTADVEGGSDVPFCSPPEIKVESVGPDPTLKTIAYKVIACPGPNDPPDTQIIFTVNGTVPGLKEDDTKAFPCDGLLCRRPGIYYIGTRAVKTGFEPSNTVMTTITVQHAADAHGVVEVFPTISTQSDDEPLQVTRLSQENIVPSVVATGAKSVTLDDLLPVVHLREKDAAKVLNMCTTKLKRVSRRVGIVRWPSRRVKPLLRKKGVEAAQVSIF